MEGDALRSIAFFSRARANSQRGFALISAIALAILYFALVELLLIDSARQLAEARRFRARVVAETLAENGAELAALKMLSRPYAMVNAEDAQGRISGQMTKTAGDTFEISGNGETSGIVRTKASVKLKGVIVGDQVRIQYAVHTP